jgi:HSP20 family protein
MMNALEHWDQSEKLDAEQHSPGGRFRSSPGQWPKGQERPFAVTEWSPLVDISEDDKEYQIHAELPGVGKADVKVTAEEGKLTITGESSFAKGDRSKKYHRVERAHGRFGRSFSIPDDANPARLSAEFSDGVLRVRLAKNETSQPQPEGAADEITLWWQKTLGKKAVLGQASNRPPPWPRAPVPIRLWTRPESEHAQRAKMVVEARPSATERNGVKNPRAEEQRGHRGWDGSLVALGQLKRWSGAVVGGGLLFLVMVLLRLTGAVFATIRAALGILTAGCRRVRNGPRSLRGLNPLRAPSEYPVIFRKP